MPVLICYGLVGRWTMTDLQEDRSLVRNLLNLGLDLYVVDWGNPSRADRYLTLDDYILGYLDGCVAEIAKRAGVPKVNLLGVCEGGVFTTAFAALEPERVNTLTLTITPIDFHADTVEDRLGHGFINIWTRSISPEDVDRLIDANGNLPGEFMGAIFNQMSPMRSLLKYNLDLLEIVDDEAAADELAPHGEVDRRSAGPPRRGSEAMDEGSVSAKQTGPQQMGTGWAPCRSRQYPDAGPERLCEG